MNEKQSFITNESEVPKARLQEVSSVSAGIKNADRSSSGTVTSNELTFDRSINKEGSSN